MTATRAEHVHCSRCGQRVSGVDPELGLVVRAWVQCPDCLSKPPCINCDELILHAARYFGPALGVGGDHVRVARVGPLCEDCDRVIKAHTRFWR